MPTEVAIASSRVGNVKSRKGARTHGGLPIPDNHRLTAATGRPLDRPAGPARSLEGGCTGFALMYAISAKSVRRETKGLARVEPGRALSPPRRVDQYVLFRPPASAPLTPATRRSRPAGRAGPVSSSAALLTAMNSLHEVG